MSGAEIESQKYDNWIQLGVEAFSDLYISHRIIAPRPNAELIFNGVFRDFCMGYEYFKRRSLEKVSEGYATKDPESYDEYIESQNWQNYDPIESLNRELLLGLLGVVGLNADTQYGEGGRKRKFLDAPTKPNCYVDSSFVFHTDSMDVVYNLREGLKRFGNAFMALSAIPDKDLANSNIQNLIQNSITNVMTFTLTDEEARSNYASAVSHIFNVFNQIRELELSTRN